MSASAASASEKGFAPWDTGRLDPRGYDVHPVSGPNEVERAHHYLWRFWRDIPKAGHLGMFEREAAFVEEKIDRETGPEKEARLAALDEAIAEKRKQLAAKAGEIDSLKASRQDITKLEACAPPPVPAETAA